MEKFRALNEFVFFSPDMRKSRAALLANECASERTAAKESKKHKWDMLEFRAALGRAAYMELANECDADFGSGTKLRLSQAPSTRHLAMRRSKSFLRASHSGIPSKHNLGLNALMCRMTFYGWAPRVAFSFTFCSIRFFANRTAFQVPFFILRITVSAAFLQAVTVW